MKTLVCLGVFGWLLSFVAQGAERHALVIGNAAYQHGVTLANPVNDAVAVAAELKRGGWQVTELRNAGVKEMLRGLRQFCEAAEGADAAVFFFAGHGLEVKGKNYLLPVDAVLAEEDAEDALALETLALEKVLEDLGGAGVRLKALVLDCCRDNPLKRNWLAARSSGGGMAAVAENQLPEGTMLVFSTAPGMVADDGRGKNSPFTTALVARLQAGGGGMADVFGDVATAMGKQQPAWIRFDGSGLSFTAFRQYPLVPEAGSAIVKVPPAPMPSPVLPEPDPLAGVSKEKPFVNGLGMKFVPAGTPGLLFSVWETRVKDFEAFVAETGHDAVSENAFGTKAYTLEKGTDGKAGWLQKGGSWKDPRFPSSQTGEHPVVCVSYLDAEAFCAWLTKRDQASGKLPTGALYRLPSDVEWSRACGPGEFPWGDHFPPRNGDGNYCGSEAMVGVYAGYSNDLVKAGFKDGAARTAVVGMYGENRYGLYDMGGNVWEWCSTWYTPDLNDAAAKEAYPVLKDDGGGRKYRVMRGASWADRVHVILRSSCRFVDGIMDRYGNVGFRCVVVR